MIESVWVCKYTVSGEKRTAGLSKKEGEKKNENTKLSKVLFFFLFAKLSVQRVLTAARASSRSHGPLSRVSRMLFDERQLADYEIMYVCVVCTQLLRKSKRFHDPVGFG